MPALALADVMHTLDLAVFSREGNGALRLVGRAPVFLETLWPSVAKSGMMESVMEVSPYLDNFLIDAETHWKSGRSGRVRSGPWVETTEGGAEHNLEATAVSIAGTPTLLVEDLGEDYQQRRQLLQLAREKMLDYETLNTEVQRKEVLLHCVIHDMCSPLQNIMMALAMLDNEILAPEVRGMVQLALQAGKRQEGLIDNVLHTYASEVRSLYGQDDGSWPGLDLHKSAHVVIDLHRPLFAQQNLTIAFLPDGVRAGIQQVRGDAHHFERVLGNLVGNALRHAPEGSTVTVRFENEPEWVKVSVEDEGGGVTPHVQAQLFEKFQQGAVGRGKVGLGLYFCRITVSKWGGESGYTPRSGGGSIFWFRLPRNLNYATT